MRQIHKRSEEAEERRSHCHPTHFPCRHRACNMFLERYKATWILTEDHSFEDRMIDDLSVSWGLPGNVGAELNRAEVACCTSPGIIFHIERYEKDGLWLRQNQRRVQDVGHLRKKSSPSGLWVRQEGILEAPSPTPLLPAESWGARGGRGRSGGEEARPPAPTGLAL